MNSTPAKVFKLNQRSGIYPRCQAGFSINLGFMDNRVSIFDLLRDNWYLPIFYANRFSIETLHA